MAITIDLNEIDDLDRSEWRNLGENSATPYYINQEFDYADILSSHGVRSYFMHVRDGSGFLIGGICLYQSETKFGKILSHNGGPIFLENHLEETKMGIVTFYKKYRRSFLNISLQFLPPYELFLKSGELGNPLNPDYTSIIDLNRPWELIEKGIRKQRRNSIQQARKKGYEVRVLTTPSEWMQSYEIFQNHAVSHNYPVQSLQLWKQIFERYKESGKRVAFGAFLDNKMVATLGITVIHRYSTLNYLATKNNDYTSASSLLTFEGIKYSKCHGSSLFNLSGLPPKGSFLEGIGIFKGSFGGVTVPQEGYCSNPFFRVAISVGRNVRISNYINYLSERNGAINVIFWKMKQNSSNVPIPEGRDSGNNI